MRRMAAAIVAWSLAVAGCAPTDNELDWGNDAPGEFLHSGSFDAPAPARIDFGSCDGLGQRLARLRANVERRSGGRPMSGAISCARLPDHTAQIFSSLWIVREGSVARCERNYCTTWFVTVSDDYPEPPAPVMSRGPFVAAATAADRSAACRKGVVGACARLRPIAEAGDWRATPRPGWVSDNAWNYVVDLGGLGPTATALGLGFTAVAALPYGP